MDAFFTKTEKAELTALYRRLMQSAGDSIAREDVKKLKNYLIKAAADNNLQRNNFGMNPVIRDMQTAVIVSEEIGMKGSVITGIMLHEIVKSNMLSLEDVRAAFGDDVASIIKGLVKTNELYAKSPAIESENFLSLPPDMEKKYTEMFKSPEEFFRTSEGIKVVKMEPKGREKSAGMER